jgi:hypothetical protein
VTRIVRCARLSRRANHAFAVLANEPGATQGAIGSIVRFLALGQSRRAVDRAAPAWLPIDGARLAVITSLAIPVVADGPHVACGAVALQALRVAAAFCPAVRAHRLAFVTGIRRHAGFAGNTRRRGTTVRGDGVGAAGVARRWDGYVAGPWGRTVAHGCNRNVPRAGVGVGVGRGWTRRGLTAVGFGETRCSADADGQRQDEPASPTVQR